MVGGGDDAVFVVSADGTRLTILEGGGRRRRQRRKKEGEYTCRAENRMGAAEYSVQVELEKKSKWVAA